MYVNQKKVKQFFHAHDKRISKEAIIALNVKIENILWSAVRLSRNFRTIKDTEIHYANGKGG